MSDAKTSFRYLYMYSTARLLFVNVNAFDLNVPIAHRKEMKSENLYSASCSYLVFIWPHCLKVSNNQCNVTIFVCKQKNKTNLW